MSDVFALDEAGARSQAMDAQNNLVAPEDIHPGFWTGTTHSIGMAIPRAFADIAKGGELAGGAAVGFAEPFLGYREGTLTDRYYATVDPTLRNAVDYWTPDPASLGTAARVLGGLTEGLTQLGAGGGNPTLMLAASGLTGAENLSDQGVSPDVAAAGGTIDALANAVGFKIPFLGKSLLTRISSGAAGNVLLGRAATGAQQQLLARTGNTAAAAHYDPWDLQSAALDALMGAAFGGLANRGAKIDAMERDAALAALNAKHFQADTAPGEPADLQSSVAHQEAIEQAIHQILRGDPVTPTEQIMGAGFVPTPRADRLPPLDSTATRAAAREQMDHIVEVLSGAKSRGIELATDLDQLDAERAKTDALNQPPEEKPLVVPEQEIAAAKLEPAQKEQLGSVYAHAVQAKPVLDQAAIDISKEIGTPHKPMLTDLKGVPRAVEKTLTDYGGQVGLLKDVARTTIVADNLDQVHRAIGAVRARFGEPTKLRYTLDPQLETPDGYRDVLMHVNLKGRPVEVQVTVPEMAKAKAQLHELYEERRTLQAKADGGESTPEAIARVRELNDKMHATYAAAWEAFLRRSKSDSRSGVPSEVARLSENGRPSGTSQARIETPPSGRGIAETGTPSTSQNMGSMPMRGRFTGEPPTGEIIAKSGTSGPDGIGKEIKADPDVESARQLIAENPDFKVATGEFSADGTLTTANASELLARGQEEIDEAERQRPGYTAAAECALQMDAA
ncbi:MAG: hypothetical protein V4457_06180 [Pseudomonadota bacterium]